MTRLPSPLNPAKEAGSDIGWPFQPSRDPTAIVIQNPALRRVLAERKKESAQ